MVAGASFFFWDDGTSLAKQSSATTLLALPQGPASDEPADAQLQSAPSPVPGTAPAVLVGTAANNVDPNPVQVTCQRQAELPPVQFTPYEPLKSPNFVYVHANQAVALCMKDSAGKISQFNLAANESKVVLGQAPMSLFAGDLSDLQIYFQGRKVRELPKMAHELILNPVAMPDQEIR